MSVLATVLPHYPFLRQFSDKLVSEPRDNALYLQWLKTYLQSIVNEPVENITVHEKMIHYNNNGRVTEDSSKTLYSIQ